MIFLLIYYFPQFDKINLCIFDNKIYQQINCIKSYIWSEVILLVGIALFCNQGYKFESLEERKDIM